MKNLELILTHRLGSGAAVFVDTVDNTVYLMHSPEDNLHPHERERDKKILLQKGLDKPIPDPDKSFTNKKEAENYVRALAAFDEMIEYVIVVYNDREFTKVIRTEADVALQEIRDKIDKKILETTPSYCEMLNYLNMKPEDILEDLKSKQKEKYLKGMDKKLR